MRVLTVKCVVEGCEITASFPMDMQEAYKRCLVCLDRNKLASTGLTYGDLLHYLPSEYIMDSNIYEAAKLLVYVIADAAVETHEPFENMTQEADYHASIVESAIYGEDERKLTLYLPKSYEQKKPSSASA